MLLVFLFYHSKDPPSLRTPHASELQGFAYVFRSWVSDPFPKLTNKSHSNWFFLKQVFGDRALLKQRNLWKVYAFAYVLLAGISMCKVVWSVLAKSSGKRLWINIDFLWLPRISEAFLGLPRTSYEFPVFIRVKTNAECDFVVVFE